MAMTVPCSVCPEAVALFLTYKPSVNICFKELVGKILFFLGEGVTIYRL